MSFLFKNNLFVKVIYLLSRCYKIRFSLWNANITDRNVVCEQNLQNKHSEQPHLFYQPSPFFWEKSEPPSFFSNILKI